MSCDEMRDRMLEAPLAALAGEGASPLARHLGECASCRSHARRIVAGTRALADRLDALEPRISGDEAVRLARPERAITGSVGPERRSPAAAWIAIPLAAAAAVAWLLIPGDGPRPAGPEHAPPPERASSDPGFRIEVPVGRRVAVFETPDPEIRVVWFY